MSSTPQHFNQDELELTVNGRELTVDVQATGTYTHIPGRRYMANGDPGYPDEDDFEIDNVEATWYDEDGKRIPETEDMAEALDSYLREKADWEDDDPPEPDYDDYVDDAVERYEHDCIRMGY